MAPEDFTYMYWISFNNPFRPAGTSVVPVAGSNTQNFSASATCIFTYTDV